MAKPKPLTATQQRFLDDYLIHGNWTRAYRSTFPNATYGTCRAEAARLLAIPSIRRELKAARRALSRRARVSADGVLRALAAIAFADVIDLFDADDRLRPVREIPYSTRRALASVKVRTDRTTTATTVARRGRTTTTTTATVRSKVEYRFADKLAALRQLCKFHGLDEGLPPLDMLLSVLPPDAAEYLREQISEAANGRPRTRSG